MLGADAQVQSGSEDALWWSRMELAAMNYCVIAGRRRVKPETAVCATWGMLETRD